MKYSPEIIWREISKSIQRWRPNNKVILKLIANGRCKRRKLLEAGMALVLSRRRLQIQAFLLAAMLLVSQNTSTVYHRSFIYHLHHYSAALRHGSTLKNEIFLYLPKI